MAYYSHKLYLAQVDRDDNIISPIERWEAHKKGILHRGFTLVLFYNEKLILQHRKHPAFDGCWDMTFSSHQIYVNNGYLQNNLTAIYEALKREWRVEKEGLKNEPKFLGKIYYKARDPKSIYTEHEIDHIYFAELKDKPDPNLEYAYGFQLVESLEIEVAPWVKKILADRLI